MEGVCGRNSTPLLLEKSRVVGADGGLSVFIKTGTEFLTASKLTGNVALRSAESTHGAPGLPSRQSCDVLKVMEVAARSSQLAARSLMQQQQPTRSNKPC